ncbi:hypothetical protein GCM10009831_31170 [Dietzia cercidiphylli]|uniref:Uncharacterized protein n=1 Tax=Dietzia cercidiphylli TaxID=498199 RepID=A0ABN2J6E0_9ACTN
MPDVPSSSSPLVAPPHPTSLVERAEGPTGAERTTRTEWPAGTERSTGSERSRAGPVLVATVPVVSALRAGAAATPGVSAPAPCSRGTVVARFVCVVDVHRRLLPSWAPCRRPSVEEYSRHSIECQRHIAKGLVRGTSDRSGRMGVDAGNTQVGPRVDQYE